MFGIWSPSAAAPAPGPPRHDRNPAGPGPGPGVHPQPVPADDSGVTAPEPQTPSTLPRRIAVVFGAWLLTLGAVVAWLVAYETEPAPAAASSAEVQAAPRWRLDIYAHPRCPCTRASIEELARLADRLGERAELHFWFFRPEREADAWAHSSTWKAASAIPGATVATDPEGRLAERAGAVASGHVVLSAPNHHVVFEGGVTLTRGHIGPSPGGESILSWALGDSGLDHAPTLGCPIRSADE